MHLLSLLEGVSLSNRVFATIQIRHKLTGFQLMQIAAGDLILYQ